MEAMFLEFLISRAYKYGRYVVLGADADIYRNFECAVYDYKRIENYTDTK